ncbi:tRNA (cytidine(34)-2'-O)-methyltransferase [Maribacter sp. 2307ULW6-5]|uniref:tRNA (cytidine(34)-2'-O)-methyltransferase n=1 Tax=Maribacter sp. 2307ULW6-5 TaxID=3386275 RepID=UPI0039BC9D4B
MPLNIVLIEPEIPNNTGNIGRLALATNSHLHLVGPLGFDLDNKRLKRAGLDYWPHISLTRYEDTHTFFEQHQEQSFAFFSSHATKTHWDLTFSQNHFLVFGKESVGLPRELTGQHPDHCYKIPMHGTHIRSLNLGNSVGIVLYEGLRQLSLPRY